MRVAPVSLSASPVSPSILDESETLTACLARLAERYPDYGCLTIVDRTLHGAPIAIGALWARAEAVQRGLVAHGLAPGDFVAIVLPTGAELVAAYFGVMLAGGVPALIATPSNRLADQQVYAARVGAILANAQAFAVYGDDEVAALLRAERAALPPQTRILTAADLAGAPACAPRPPAGEDIATVQYSSGSTGPPKGVLLSHRAILNNLRALRTVLAVRPHDVGINWIPLYHDMGLIDGFLLPLLSGCPTVLIPTMEFMRDPAMWLWAMHRFRGTQTWAPNFAYALCAKRVREADLAGLDLSSWRLALSASEPILATTLRDFSTRFAPYGFRVEAFTTLYGLAENVTAVTAHPVDAAPRVDCVDRTALATADTARPAAAGVELVSSGCPLPDCTVEIRDEQRRPLPERRVGTIWVRSTYLFARYHRDPEATAAALVGGWLNTGDRGYLHDGHLFFVARDKDLIVVGGEKYAPQDVESAINAVDGVREGCVAAFGVLNEARGTEDLAAVVETKEADPVALERLREAIRAAVLRATGLGLRHVLLVPPGGIEKTSSGKLARRATRLRYAAAWQAPAGGEA